MENVKNINENTEIENHRITVVTKSGETSWKLHQLIQQKLIIKNGLNVVSKGIKYRFEVSDKEKALIVALTTRKSHAYIIAEIPKMLQFLRDYETVLAGMQEGKDGMLYKQVNEFLNSIK